MTTPRISLISPFYNEEASAPLFIERCSAMLSGLGGSYEMIFVDDGSSDATWDILRQAAAAHQEIRAVRLSRNFGHQAALSAALAHSRGDLVVMIDSDLQDPPEEVPAMIKLMRVAGADVVYGVRTERRGVSLPLRLAYKTFYRILRWLADIEIPAESGDFRIVTRRVVDILVSLPEHGRFLRGLTRWVGFKQLPHYYSRDARAGGKSHYSLARLLALAADGIFSFSMKPLRLATVFAGGFGMLSIAAVLYIVISRLAGNSAPQGWPSLAAIMLAGFAALSILLGIIGEYVGRIFQETRQRPIYIVDHQAEKSPHQQ